MRLAITLALAAALGAVPLAGCQSKVQTITTTTETIECEPRDDFGEDYGFEAEEERECTEIRRETTVVTEDDSGCHGAISCTGSLIGALVSLPFRILGEVF
jgi:hypothetical protein